MIGASRNGNPGISVSKQKGPAFFVKLYSVCLVFHNISLDTFLSGLLSCLLLWGNAVVAFHGYFSC